MPHKYKIGDVFINKKGEVYKIRAIGDLDYFFSDKHGMKAYTNNHTDLKTTLITNGYYSIQRINPQENGPIFYWAIIPLNTDCDLTIGREDTSIFKKEQNLLFKADTEMVNLLYE